MKKGVSLASIIICLIASTTILFSNDSNTVARSNYGMVSTQDSIATHVGVAVLERGGNAVDAAYAIGYALAVTHPQAGNLGGGGFMLVHIASENKTIALDYREKAPRQSHQDLFLDSKGDVDTSLSRYSALSVGVPGTVLGLETAHQRYGVLAREDLLAYAIKLAKKGFYINEGLANSLSKYKQHLNRREATKAVFFKNGDVLKKGDRLKQPALAKTLKRLKRYGYRDFYEGKTAQKLIAYIQANEGIMSLEDLRIYEPVWRAVVTGNYRDVQIASMPPPSSGGIALIQALNILENFDLNKYGHNSADSMHIMAEALTYVYADRARFLGDTDFVDVPIKRLISKHYATSIASAITTPNISNSDVIFKQVESVKESQDTTHFVVLDSQGNCVSNTYTLNFNFGNGMLVPSLGFFLNNEMDDFSAKPGIPNAYGLLGNEKNKIEPEKRMLSSMTPTIVFKQNKPLLITGSPGGSRIITTVLQVIINIVDHNMSLPDAVTAKRFHYQGKPAILFIENNVSEQSLDTLKDRGFKIQSVNRIGSAQSILVTKKWNIGVSDPRTASTRALGEK
ncbi:gamma-glutamyltransferase [bacterium]|nr:gamma-glutamyltransferase [bacterium]